MSTQFHVDSRWRDRANTDNANPAEFFIPKEVAEGWVTENRTVQAVRPHNKPQVTNMDYTIKLLNLTIPYNIGGAIGATIIDLAPFLYVSFQSTSMYKDSKLINTLENGAVVNTTPDLSGTLVKTSLKDATFVVYCDKLQGQSGAIPTWIQYKCGMFQTYRIDLKDGLKFRVFTADGKTVPIVDATYPATISPSKQVNALFEVTPYVRDDRYDNHFVTLNQN